VTVGTGDREERLPHPAWVGVLGGLLYLPTLAYGLTRYDDPWLIRDNALLQRLDLERIGRVLFDFSVEQRLRLGAEYLPVRDLSVMLDFAIWGDGYAGHHLTQILLYGATCAFCAMLVVALFDSRALGWWVGAAFSVHPVHVEAVAWLSERKGVLGAMLFFGSALLGVRFLRSGRSLSLVGSLLLFAVSVLSKGHMVAGAAALAACALWCDDIPRARRWALGVGAFVAAPLALAPVVLVGQSVGMVQAYHGGGLGQTLLLFAQVHGKYLTLMMLGGPYAVAYPIDGDSYLLEHLALDIAGSWALVIFGFFGLRALLRRSHRGPASFGLVWWLVFLAPVSHLVFPLQNLLADRYLLVGSWGLLLVLGVGLMHLPPSTRRIVGACWLVASTVWSFTQIDHWESSKSLRLHTLSVHPGHVESWHQLASQAEEEEQYDEALLYVQRGLRSTSPLAADRWRLFHRGALILRKQRRAEDALRWMRIAAATPDAHKAYANLALMLAERGELEEALAQARTSTELESRSSHNQRVHGIVALELGRVDEACEAFIRARSLDPFDAKNHFNVGLCEWQRGNRREANAALRRALQIDPTLAAAVEQARQSER